MQITLLDVPVVTLNSPLNGSWFNSSTVEFNYTVTGTNLDSCVLYADFDGSYGLNETNSSLSSGVADVQTFTLDDGYYNWAVACNNTAGTTTNSGNYTVGVDTIYPGINFTYPTPSNESVLNVSHFFVNVTTTESNDHYSFVNLDNSLVGWWRMDNDSSVG
jgi:hypothetical protein